MTEYCTTYMMERYANHYADSTQESPVKQYWKTFNSLSFLYAEADSFIKGEDKELKEGIISLLKSYINDSRIKYFVVQAFETIHSHNATWVHNKIDEGKSFDKYLKDGYYLTGHFRDTVRELFEKNAIEGTITSVPWPKAVNTKMRVDLSVPQIATLFRMLNEHDPRIIKDLNDLELFEFITTHFTNDMATKGAISRNTLSNHYYRVDPTAKKYWVDFCRKMITFLSDN